MGVSPAEAVPGAPRLEFAESEGEIAARSPLQLFWRRFRRDRVAMVSLEFIAFLVFIAFGAPLVVKILGLPGPYVQNLNLTDEFGSPLGPTGAHPFGGFNLSGTDSKAGGPDYLLFFVQAKSVAVRAG